MALWSRKVPETICFHVLLPASLRKENAAMVEAAATSGELVEIWELYTQNFFCMHGDAHTSFLLKNSAISHVQCVVGNLANLKIQIIPCVSELFIRELNI